MAGASLAQLYEVGARMDFDWVIEAESLVEV